jgi:hypothetical protein
MEKPPCFTGRVTWGTIGLHIHTAKRLKNSAAFPCVRFNALSLWACFLRLECFAAFSSLLRPCTHLWQVDRIWRIMASARSR